MDFLVIPMDRQQFQKNIYETKKLQLSNPAWSISPLIPKDIVFVQ